MNRQPNFYRLPEELLTEIVNCILWSDIDRAEKFKILRTLHLSSRQFAYLTCLREYLFDAIYFKASLDNVELLEKTDISHIRPFVKQIFFEPVDYNCPIQQGHDSCVSRANETKMLFDSGRLQSVWSAALRILSDTNSFRIIRWKFGGWGEVHSHEDENQELACLRVKGSWGNALFTTAIASLNAAGSKILDLNISGVFGPDFAWMDDPELANINLNNLKMLRFRPACVVPEEGGWDSPQQREIEWRCSTALSSLLKKCQHSIEELELDERQDLDLEEDNDLELDPGDNCVHIIWPLDDGVIALPKLHHLRLWNIKVRPHDFASFIEKQKNLKDLRLKFTDLERDSDYSEWRVVFDAIRNHRNRMTLESFNSIGDDVAEISFIHHTSRGVNYEPSNPPFSHISESLMNYVSKTGDWNRPLRVWFDGEEPYGDGNGD